MKYLDSGWFLFIVAFVAALLMFLAGWAGAEPSWNKIIREQRQKKTTKVECYVERYRHVWQGNKLVKVPVTVCKER
jgi:hypothetical protein